MWSLQVPESDRAGFEAAVEAAEVVRPAYVEGEEPSAGEVAEEDEQIEAARAALVALADGIESSVDRLWGSAAGHACREGGGADSITVTISEVQPAQVA